MNILNTTAGKIVAAVATVVVGYLFTRIVGCLKGGAPRAKEITKCEPKIQAKSGDLTPETVVTEPLKEEKLEEKDIQTPNENVATDSLKEEETEVKFDIPKIKRELERYASDIQDREATSDTIKNSVKQLNEQLKPFFAVFAKEFSEKLRTDDQAFAVRNILKERVNGLWYLSSYHIKKLSLEEKLSIATPLLETCAPVLVKNVDIVKHQATVLERYIRPFLTDGLSVTAKENYKSLQEITAPKKRETNK